MISRRAGIGIAVSVCIFVAIANAEWSKVLRVTHFDGAIEKEHLILGRLKYKSLFHDSRIDATGEATLKVTQYGLVVTNSGGHGVVTREGPTSEFDLFQKRSGDIRKEAARVAKEMPWLKLSWHGKRFTSFYARGTHPILGGFMSVACSRLPERLHGPGQIHVTASVHE